ncbi:MAG TPA: hypothetical protein DEP42_01750, partial [Ruminococcaceae bacterium]|nr:hypothetical protein [Oscillospiraceae bacterium]
CTDRSVVCCVRSLKSICFFFQAEGGIRDLVRARGLGNVYKRQLHTLSLPHVFILILFKTAR